MVTRWRPIAFRSRRDGNYEVYVMNADGSNTRQLTDKAVLDTGPAWSPDGRQLAFASERDGNREIYVANADGSSPRRLTFQPAEDTGPAFSPDGTRIVFTSVRDGNAEIYVMGRDGSDQTRVTNAPTTEQSPDWQTILSSISPPPLARDRRAPRLTRAHEASNSRSITRKVKITG